MGTAGVGGGQPGWKRGRSRNKEGLPADGFSRVCRGFFSTRKTLNPNRLFLSKVCSSPDGQASRGASWPGLSRRSRLSLWALRAGAQRGWVPGDGKPRSGVTGHRDPLWGNPATCSPSVTEDAVMGSGCPGLGNSWVASAGGLLLCHQRPRCWHRLWFPWQGSKQLPLLLPQCQTVSGPH